MENKPQQIYVYDIETDNWHLAFEIDFRYKKIVDMWSPKYGFTTKKLSKVILAFELPEGKKIAKDGE